jgi:hypothetical protein
VIVELDGLWLRHFVVELKRRMAIASGYVGRAALV